MSDVGETRLPAGWAVAEMGDVGAVLCGQSPPSSTVNTHGEGVPYVSGPEHWDGSVVRLDKWTTAPARIVPDGTVFVTVKGAGVGTVFPGVQAAIGRDIYAFMPEPGVSPSFITHALRFTTSEIVRQSQGDIPGLSKEHILKHAIPVPPAAEQQRIANVVDELLSDLEAGVAALDRVRANLAQYRASILKDAVEGTLTADWRQQHPHTEPVTELLKRILAERRHRWEEDRLRKFNEKGQEPLKNWKAKYKEPVGPDTANLAPSPDGWCWATLGQLLDGIEAGKSFTCEPRPAKASEWGVIKVSAMSWGSFDEHENKAVPKSKDYDTAYEIRPGNLLLSRSNTVELVGAAVLVEHCRSNLLLSDKSMRLLYSPALNRRWLRICLASPQVRHQMSRMATGTSDSMRNISQENVARVRIGLPSLAEQETIVENVEDQLSVIEHLEADLDLKFKSAQALRQAILRHAFTGQLVPQHPSDEPASELLRRVVAEREASARESAAVKWAHKKTNGPAVRQRGRPKKYLNEG